MKRLLLFLLFIPLHYGFAGLKAVSPVNKDSSAKLRLGRAPSGGKYIGTVQQVSGGKFAVRLGRKVELRKKKLQVAAAAFQGKKFSGSALPAGQKPVYVYLYDSRGVKRGQAKFSAAQNSRTIVFELVKGSPQPAVGWRIGLEDLSFQTTGGRSFGLGLFYEIEWK